MTLVTQKLVDPERLLVVAFVAGADTRQLLAVSCRYVPAVGADGLRAVALEITYDPAVQAPTTTYYALPQQLATLLLDPRSVQRIRPYVLD